MPAAPAKKTYTVYLTDIDTIQVRSGPPTVDANKILSLDGSLFNVWVACIDPDTLPPAPASTGVLASIKSGISGLFGGGK